MLMALLTIAHELGLKAVYLNAQTEAVRFYSRHGFQAEGEVFFDADIPHRRMHLTLSSPSAGGGED